MEKWASFKFSSNYKDDSLTVDPISQVCTIALFPVLNVFSLLGTLKLILEKSLSENASIGLHSMPVWVVDM